MPGPDPVAGLMRPTPTLFQQLVDERVAEGQHLEYKSKSYAPTAGEKKELAKDVAAMANGGGGWLVLGVEEDGDGHASQVVGVEQPESERDFLEQVVFHGLQPRFIGFRVEVVNLPGGLGVVVLHCPRSPRGPFMVTTDNEDRFWVRRGRHKDRMDAGEVRHLVQANDLVVGDIERGWERALGRGREFALMRGPPGYVLSIAPSYSMGEVIDIKDEELRALLWEPRSKQIDSPATLASIRQFGIPVDREIAPSSLGLRVDGKVYEWRLDIERSGRITLMTAAKHLSDGDSTKRHLEQRVLCLLPVNLARLAAEVYGHVGLMGPFDLRLGLLKARSLELRVPPLQDGRYHARVEHRACDVDEVIPPGLEVANIVGPPEPFLPLIERVYQSFGLWRTPQMFFAEDGTVKGELPK